MTSPNTHSEFLSAGDQLSTDLASVTVKGQEYHIVSDVRTENLYDESHVHCAATGGKTHNMETQSEILAKAHAYKQLEADSSLNVDNNTYKPGDSFVTINTLPDELLLKILSFMSFSELIDIMAVVCTRWKRLVQDAELWYDKVYVISNDVCDKEAVRTFRMVPQLRTLVTQRVVESYVFYELSNRCAQLTTLDICDQQRLSYSCLTHLFKRCTKLHTLSVPRRLLADISCVEAVTQLKHLRALHLKEYRSENCQFQLHVLADGCPQLCEIGLAQMCIETEDMEYFISTKKHNFKFVGIRWITVSGRCVLPLLTVWANTLEHLELNCYGDPVVDAEEAFRSLGQLHNLRELFLFSLPPQPQGVVPKAFKSLSKLQLLQLYYGWHVEDEVIIAISHGCPSLCELWLQECCQLTDAAFVQIHQLKQLEILKFITCERLRGAAIPCIARLPSLHTLHFRNTKFEDLQPGLESILDISALRRLELFDSIVRPIPFDRFPGKLVNLREIYLENCGGDQSILDKLCAQMPELQVDGYLYDAS